MIKRNKFKPIEEHRQTHFSLRKLSIGLASVLLGTSIYFLQNDTQVVKADSVTNDPQTEEVNTVKTDDKVPNLATTTAELPNTAKNNAGDSSSGDNKTNDSQGVTTNSNAQNTTSDTTQTNKNDTAGTTGNTDSTSNTGATTPNISDKTPVSTTDKNKQKDATEVADGTWNGLKVVYDEKTKTLSIPGGSITDPKTVANNIKNYDQIEHINILDKLSIYGDAIGFFGNLPKLVDITGLENLDTKNVTNMDKFFANDTNLASLDLKAFDTQNASSMRSMFSNCTTLTELDLSNFNTKKVQFMMHMFDGATNLQSIDARNFDNSALIDTSYMFYNAKALSKVNVNFNCDKLELAMHMFDGCESLVNVNLTGFTGSNLRDMSYMFSNCTNLEIFDAGDTFNTYKVEYINHLFGGDAKLKQINMNISLNSAVDASYLFDGCSSLESAKVVIDSQESDKPVLRFADYMFNNCTSLKSATVQSLVPIDTIEDVTYMFYNCSSLQNCVVDLDTQNVQFMNNMFDGCTSLEKLDLSKLNVGKVDNMSYMFNNMPKLSAINLTGWNPSNIVYSSHMFDGDTALTSVDLSTWETPKLQDSSYMFNNCTSLTNVKLDKFNVEQALYLNNMFNNCASLKKLDVSNFKTTNAISLNNMFYGDKLLEQLDLSNFDMTKTVYPYNMLTGLTNLKVLKLGPKTIISYAGLDTPKGWVRLAGGSLDKPLGKVRYTSPQLSYYYNGATDADTYIHSDAKEYNIKVEYRDLDSNKVFYSNDLTGVPKLNIPYGQVYDKVMALIDNTKYVYSSKDSTLPLAENHDIAVPTDLTGDITYIVGFKHKTAEIKPGENNPLTNQPDEKQTKTVTRSIRYTKTDTGTVKDVVQTVTFTRNATVDLVTGNVTYGAWDKDQATFDKIETPDIKGYKADIPVVDSETVTPTSLNIYTLVTYYPLPQTHYVFKFIDIDAHNIALADPVVISTYETESFDKTEQISNILKQLADKHYKLVKDLFDENGKFHITSNETSYNFEFTHETEPRQIKIAQKCIVHYVDKDGNTLLPDTTFDRFSGDNSLLVTYNYDLARNTVAYNDGIKVVKPAKPTWVNKTPVINGYFANVKSLAENNMLGTDRFENIDQKISSTWIRAHLDGGSLPDYEFTVTYQKLGKFIPVDSQGNELSAEYQTVYKNDPNDATKILFDETIAQIPGHTISSNPAWPSDLSQSLKQTYYKNNQTIISFVDQDNNNQAITGIDPITTSATVGKQLAKPKDIDNVIAKLKQAGYELVSDPFSKSVIAQEDKQELTYIFKHKTNTVNDSVTRKHIVHLVDSDGKQLASDITKNYTFTRNGAKDLVTGKIVWDAWPNNQATKVVNVPVVNGYLADSKEIALQEITPDSNLESTVKYQKLGKIVAVDSNNKPITNIPSVIYENDPTDPTKIKADQKVTKVKGYTTKVDTVNPDDPTKDTLVVYEKDKPFVPANPTDYANLEIVVHDDATKQDLDKYYWNSGKVSKGTIVTYDWTKIKQELLTNGYTLVNEPAIPSTCDQTAERITIHVTHNTAKISSKYPQVAGEKIPNSNAVWPAKDKYETIGKYVVYFKNINGKQIAKPVVQHMKFSRELLIDLATGEIINPNAAWIPEINNYRDVKVPQIVGYRKLKNSSVNSTIVNNMLLGPAAIDLDLSDTVLYERVSNSNRGINSNHENHLGNSSNNGTSSSNKVNISANNLANSNNNQAQPSDNVNDANLKPKSASLLPQTGTKQTDTAGIIGLAMILIGLGLLPIRKPDKD